MVFRKSLVALCSSTRQAVPLNSSVASSTSSPSTGTSPDRKFASTSTALDQQQCRRQQAHDGVYLQLPPRRDVRRAYATTTADRHASKHGSRPPTEHEWPQPLFGQVHPTPYQIFGMKTGAAYNKARFFELVKLYHPDRHDAAGPHISHAIRAERYRLVVAANSILADPVKRSAYDRFGSGWNGRREIDTQSATDSWGSSSPFSAHNPAWHDPADPIWRNATWEDWERWQAARDAARNGDPEPGAPLYMANSYFLACVVVLAAIGGFMNYGRAQDAGTYFVEQRDIVHDRAAKELRRVRQETLAMASREDRIGFFVKQRDATLGMGEIGVEELRDDRAGRVLSQREICGSGDERTREDDR